MQLTSKDILQRFPELETSTILLAGYRGSHAHGTYLPPDDPNGTDDIDLFAVFSRGRSFYGSMYDYGKSQDDTLSSAGETLDIEAVELRKFLSLLSKGNPNVHGYLWTDSSDLVFSSPAGEVLQANRTAFFSQKMLLAFGGYVHARLRGLQKPQKLRYMGAKREELLTQHGYDIKDAAHCVRLAYQMRVLCDHHELPVKLTGEVLDTVKAIKTGRIPLEQVTLTIRDYLEEAERAAASARDYFPTAVPDWRVQDVFVQVMDALPKADWGGPSC